MSQAGITGTADGIGFGRLKGGLPPKAHFRAHLMPIFLEPVEMSGERLCIGVAARSTTGDTAVALALEEQALQAAFGRRHAASLLAIARLALDDCKAFLEKGGGFTAWTPPLSGIRSGGPLTAASRFGMTGVLREGLMRSACFSALLFDPREEAEEERRTTEEDRWPKQVRSAVFSLAPQLDHCFHRDFAIAPGARKTTIDFIGARLAASLGKLIPSGQLSRQVKDAKVRLWDLDALRTLQGTLFPLAHYELLLYRPANSDPTYSDRHIDALNEAVLELTETADHHKIRVVTFTAAENAAARIVQQEAA